MLCPQCQQGVQDAELAAGACPYCGFACEEFQKRVNMIQIILAALFGSTLIYGVIVAVLELYAGYEAPGLGGNEMILGMALVGCSAGIVAASFMFERRTRGAETLRTWQQTTIILGAIAEAPAIFGLIMYLIAGSLPWMVLFLGISWALMIRLGLKLPLILRGMTDCLRTE
jgi:F0F1-type ATP synthase membrane subunit c/vacuolar-type H+-ATPase subunit K